MLPFRKNFIKTIILSTSCSVKTQNLGSDPKGMIYFSSDVLFYENRRKRNYGIRRRR